jgi:trans-aconitate methyltransferase
MSAQGVELDGDVVALAQDRQLPVFSPDQLAERVPLSTLDLLTAWDVLEHIHDPLPTLSGYVERLRPGGALLLEVPDGGFPLRRRRWPPTP